MTPKAKVLFCWSGGKDSALCLHRVLQSEHYEVVALLTTLNEHYHRVSMHRVREQLLDAQAQSIGLPLEKMFVSQISTTEEYAAKMRDILLRYQAAGVTQVVFGDIFLEDLRQWRESNLASIGLRGLFPLWKCDTHQLMTEFIRLGFRAVICCVNDAYLGEASVGAGNSMRTSNDAAAQCRSMRREWRVSFIRVYRAISANRFRSTSAGRFIVPSNKPIRPPR